MKQFMKTLFITTLMLLSALTQAKTGLLFQVNQTGAPASAKIMLCLNGKGPLSCQQYSTAAQNLAIHTTLKHTYPTAGIKVITPGYRATGCTPYSNGFCLFSANGNTAATLTVKKTTPSNYTVGGHVNGLIGTLILENNSGDAVTMNVDGSFTFPTTLEDGSTYAVTVQSQPATQTCTVNNGGGTINGSNVTNVQVSCSTNTHTIGGTVTGLDTAHNEEVVLQNNGSDDLSRSANGGFTFTTSVAQGATYDVTVSTQPNTQTCTVAQGSGSVSTSDITNVQVTCSTNTYTVGGTVSGLTGTVVLQNNGANDSIISANGSFTFATPVADGASYALTVLTQPSGQTCSVSNGSGTISGANVSNVAVDCLNNTTLTTSVSTLALSVTGASRVITIANMGSDAAVNLLVTPPAWPSGTTNSTTCGSSLAAGDTCTITVTPGNTATSDGTNPCSNGTAPVAGTVTVRAANASTVSSDVVVLNYGCIYQGGYVFALDDTTAISGSVGGKVVATADQAPRNPNGVIWSSNGSGGASSNVAYNSIWGIALGSCSNNPSNCLDSGVGEALPNATLPVGYTATKITGQSNCYGSYYGACNSTNIVVYYSAPNTSPSVNTNYYAAGRCKAYAGGGFNDWYLPAVCEMGPASNSSGCASSTPNIVTNLSGLLSSNATNADNHVCAFGGGCLFGYYWSSTEISNVPQTHAWFQYFASGSGSFQAYSNKPSQHGVRCVRTLAL